jgi:hypothetical protein
MEAELAHWDFERVKQQSFDEWNHLLGLIQVEGGPEVEIRRFYTDLWHALQGRRIDPQGALRRELYLCNDRCFLHPLSGERLPEGHPGL